MTFKQRECTPFEEYIKQTGINISTEPRHRPKNIQPVPEFDQERVTKDLVDNTNNRIKSILKNDGSHITAPQSPQKEPSVNPVRAGNLPSPTMDKGTEAVDTTKTIKKHGDNHLQTAKKGESRGFCS